MPCLAEMIVNGFDIQTHKTGEALHLRFYDGED
jgi:hypothetical protein